MRNLVLIGALGVLTPSVLDPSATLLAADAADLPGAELAVLAWIRFVDGEEEYAGVPYLWLGKVNVSLIAEEPWSGKLVFDKPRHKVQMRLPLDYPRINQFPEWFVARADRQYTVRDANAGSEASSSGQQLQAGMPMKLEPGKELRLIVGPSE